jgi:hypothetical protein
VPSSSPAAANSPGTDRSERVTSPTVGVSVRGVTYVGGSTPSTVAASRVQSPRSATVSMSPAIVSSVDA